MSDIFNSRSITSMRFQSYYGPPGDLGIGTEPLRESRYQNIAAATHATEAANGANVPRLGEIFQTYDNRVFKYAVASVALVEGSVLAPTANVAAITDLTSADSLTAATELTKSTATFTINQYAGWWCSQVTGTGLGQCRRIIGNNATTIFLEAALLITVDTTSDFVVFHPCAVKKTATALFDRVSGVSIGTIASGSYGWIQVYGFCENVLVDAAVTAGKFLVPSDATAGQAEVANASTADLTTPFATAMTVGGTNVYCAAFLWGCCG